MMLASMRWEVEGQGTDGYVHADLRILRVEGDALIARVLKSNRYPVGSYLAVRRHVASHEQRHVGADLSFTCAGGDLSKLVIENHE